MAKKKIIINREQLRRLNEVDLSVTAQQNTSADYGASLNNTNVRDDLQKLKNTGDPGAIVSGPNTNDQMPVVDVNVQTGMNPSDVLNEPSVSAAIKNGASARVHGDGFPMEGVKYTKKQLEEVRLANIKENGRICTKKTLFNA